jgi:hypothetical protein
MNININQCQRRRAVNIGHMYKEQVSLNATLSIQPEARAHIATGYVFEFLRHHSIEKVHSIRAAHSNGAAMRHIQHRCAAPECGVLKFK